MMESGQKLYTRMRLWEFPDRYVIEPTDGTSGSSLSVDRANATMKLIDDIPECTALRLPKIRTIFGILGMLKLKDSSADQKKVEVEFSGLLKVAEKTRGLYFSYDINLTLSAQTLHKLSDESKFLPLWRQAEPRFLWNSYMLETLVENKLDPYLLPVIQGSFQTFQSAIGKVIVDVTLIARRCTRRNGTRLWRRGADADGYVANFVESEQIIQFNGYTSSFLQIRGSIPLLWDQIVDLTYKPNFELINPEDAPQVLERHFLDVQKNMGQ